jgi:predicted DCC family thiol-disulfide oxidoreductase YuxK
VPEPEATGDSTGESPAVRGPILLYDGECGLCARSVQFVLAHESPDRSTRRCALRFAPLQGTLAARVRADHPMVATIDSVVWIEIDADGHEQVAVRSAAALSALAYLGGGWRLLARAGRLVPRPVRDAVYDIVARHRQALMTPSCLLPTPEQRRRFLD